MHPSWIIGVIAIIFIAHPATSIKCFVGPIDTLKMGEFVTCVKVFIAETKQSWYEGSNTTFLEFNKICHVTYEKEYKEVVERCFCDNKHLCNFELESNSPDAHTTTAKPMTASEMPVDQQIRTIEQKIDDFRRASAPVVTGRD
ncbi:hypothetical protein L3Y34_012931 [Caenorhabditis briggsae]|uniref:Uncharacterized protein n=1 Tax=Caenorhabditis briggsae TaxID=6238 RepID=A0AAE8ZQF6_CAEBR|nr:hypothetical protein L3Y34_012931 [Caenorhabditis briggsae]